MAERIAIIGLGRFGLKLAQALSAAGAEVIAIDERLEIVEDVSDQVTLAIRLDATDEQGLRAQGIDKVDVAVVAIGADFEANALTTSTLKAIGVKRVISRAGSEIRGEILRRIGADDIVFPEHESAARWVHRLLLPAITEWIELGEGYSLVQLPAPKSFSGKSLRDLEVRQRFKVNVVAVRKSISPRRGAGDKHEIVTPLPDTVLGEADTLWLVGTNEAIASLPKD